jgi:hypothetical protein
MNLIWNPKVHKKTIKEVIQRQAAVLGKTPALLVRSSVIRQEQCHSTKNNAQIDFKFCKKTRVNKGEAIHSKANAIRFDTK